VIQNNGGLKNHDLRESDLVELLPYLLNHSYFFYSVLNIFL